MSDTEIKKMLEDHIIEEGDQLGKVLERLEALAAQVEANGSNISAFQAEHDRYVNAQKPMQQWYKDVMSVQRVVKWSWAIIGYIAIFVGVVSVSVIAIRTGAK